MSLYLKYRPHDFKNLVWQEFIKQTLQKAILEDKTVGAYLFCGPRGTGKTSTARIFAKALNCTDLQKDGNPCLKCDICTWALDNSLIDIIEIDAASHTWVDNIRDIIEKAQFQPTKTAYKIYIVDEVHMLSKWAFNALLKILEEPPIHVKFILATTEVHKVLDTILSRCQRFDFKSISDDDIKSRLEFVAKSEKVKVDTQSLDYIVKNSAWALRNAISLFEQLIINNEIKYENIVETLWISSSDEIGNFLQMLLEDDMSILEKFDEIQKSGKNLKLFFKDLIFFAKDKAIEEIKSWNSIERIIKVLEELNDTYWKSKYSLDEATTFLIGILKIVSGYQKEVVVEQKITPQKASIAPAIKPLVQPHPEEIKSEPKAVSLDDATQLFDAPTPVSVSKTSWDAFSIVDFIAEVKKIWAPGGVTMALRASNIILEWTVLTVKFKTPIGLKSVQNNGGLGHMQNALESMWMTGYQINIS